jgi:hypothetical protein
LLPPCATLKVLGVAVSVKFGPEVTVRLMVVVCDKPPEVPVTATAIGPPMVAVALAVRVKTLVLLVLVGLNAAVTPFGKVEVTARLTLPAKPFVGCTVIVLVLLLPCMTLTLVGAAVSVKPAAVPENGISSGLGLALLITVSPPTIDPPTVGANWISTMQALFAARVPPESEHVVPLGWIWKSALGTMLFRVTALVPLLVMVTGCAALVVPIDCVAKVTFAGAMVRGANEVPVRLTTSGLLLLLGVKGTAAVPSMTPTNAG